MSVQKVNNDGSTSLIAGGTLYADSPLGSILPFGGASAPTGWMLCQGQAISRITYADLFAVIGTSFGAGDGSTTFNIPDLRGEFIRGAGTNSHSGQGSGGNVGVHQDGTEHNTAFVNSARYGVFTRGTEQSKADSSISLSGSYTIGPSYIVDTPSTNAGKYTSRPTNTSVNFIIKVSQVALPADLESAVEDAVEDALDGIGTITKATTNIGTAVSCASQSTTILTSISLDAGTYVLSASADHTSANAEAVISITEGIAINDEFKQFIPSVTAYSANTGNVTAILKLTATTTVRLVCWSAGNLNVTPHSLVATKVA